MKDKVLDCRVRSMKFGENTNMTVLADADRKKHDSNPQTPAKFGSEKLEDLRKIKKNGRDPVLPNYNDPGQYLEIHRKVVKCLKNSSKTLGSGEMISYLSSFENSKSMGLIEKETNGMKDDKAHAVELSVPDKTYYLSNTFLECLKCGLKVCSVKLAIEHYEGHKLDTSNEEKMDFILPDESVVPIQGDNNASKEQMVVGSAVSETGTTDKITTGLIMANECPGIDDLEVTSQKVLGETSDCGNKSTEPKVFSQNEDAGNLIVEKTDASNPTLSKDVKTGTQNVCRVISQNQPKEFAILDRSNDYGIEATEPLVPSPSGGAESLSAVKTENFNPNPSKNDMKNGTEVTFYQSLSIEASVDCTETERNLSQTRSSRSPVTKNEIVSTKDTNDTARFGRISTKMKFTSEEKIVSIQDKNYSAPAPSDENSPEENITPKVRINAEEDTANFSEVKSDLLPPLLDVVPEEKVVLSESQSHTEQEVDYVVISDSDEEIASAPKLLAYSLPEMLAASKKIEHEKNVPELKIVSVQSLAKDYDEIGGAAFGAESKSVSVASESTHDSESAKKKKKTSLRQQKLTPWANKEKTGKKKRKTRQRVSSVKKSQNKPTQQDNVDSMADDNKSDNFSDAPGFTNAEKSPWDDLLWNSTKDKKLVRSRQPDVNETALEDSESDSSSENCNADSEVRSPSVPSGNAIQGDTKGHASHRMESKGKKNPNNSKVKDVPMIPLDKMQFETSSHSGLVTSLPSETTTTVAVDTNFDPDTVKSPTEHFEGARKRVNERKSTLRSRSNQKTHEIDTTHHQSPVIAALQPCHLCGEVVSSVQKDLYSHWQSFCTKRDK